MIVKPSTKAADLSFLEEIIADEEFQTLPAATQERLKRHRRGLWGERDTAHMLDRHFHAATNTAVIHDLRIPDGMGGFAQFDHLLLHRGGELATIIEVKNYAGTLSKNEHDEWIVWYKGQRLPKDIPNPVAQAQRQREVFRSWLRQHGLSKAFPNINVFVSVPPECKIDRSKVGHDVPIVKSDNLFAAWERSFEVSALDVLLSGRISSLQLQQVAKRIAKAHVPGKDIYDELGLRPTDEDAECDGTAFEAEEVPPSPAAEAEHASTDLSPFPGLPNPQTLDSGVPLIVAPVTEAAPESKEQPRREKAVLQSLCDAIFERVLRDGRIGFSAHSKNEDAKARLAEACRGRAHWISRYQNWVCDDDKALEIRSLLGSSTIDEVPGTGQKSADGAELPAETPIVPSPAKRAGAPSVVCDGITVRELPDGRHAFRASNDDEPAKEALSAACKGVGQWNPLYRNWIVPAERAPAIRAAVLAALPDHASPHNTSAPHTRETGAKQREVTA